MTPQQRNDLGLAVSLAVVVALLVDGGGLPSVLAPKPTAAHYVYEKDDTQVPPAVKGAINQLQTDLGISASTTDDDVTTGDGRIPKQYATAIPAAREHGLPCLVVLAGDEVLRIVSEPTTGEEVLGAVE